MTHGLIRFHESRDSHFLTFSCYHRQPNFSHADLYNIFLHCLEAMRIRFAMNIYGYVIMPEHVHLLVSESDQATLAEAMHFLKLSSSKRVNNLQTPPASGSFWQKRYYDRNVRDTEEFQQKLRYIHRNPVKRGLAKDAAEWPWSSFRHYALREAGPVEIESEWTARDRGTKDHPVPASIFLIPG